MTIDKQALMGADQSHQIDISATAAHAAGKDHQAVQQAQHPPAAPAQVPAPETWRQKLLRGVSHNLHYFTFLPLILISVFQDINLQLGTLLCTGIVVCILLLSFIGHRAGYIKVFPKPFDLFNLALYGTMVVLAFCAHDWLRIFDSLITNAGNALFMWATIILPCTDNFVMHSVRDKAPEQVVKTPLMQRMALLIALNWATALTLMTAGSIIPLATGLAPGQMPMGLMVVTYVLGYGPLLLALPIQMILMHVYRKKIRQRYQQHLQQPQPQQAAVGEAARDDIV